MKRTWLTWVLFCGCLGVLLAVMGWVTGAVLRLERAGVEAQRKAAIEETVRLALWRLDAAVTPLIIEESARPYFEYSAFNPAEVVYRNAPLNRSAAADMIPSPLLSRSASNIVVYFNDAYEEGKGGSRLTTPQVPPGNLDEAAVGQLGIPAAAIASNRANFARFTASVSPQDIKRAFEKVPLTEGAIEVAVRHPVQTGQQGQAPALQQVGAMNQSAQQGQAGGQQQTAMNQPAQQFMPPAAYETEQQMRNVDEFQTRKGQTDKSKTKFQQSKQQAYGAQSNIKSIPKSAVQSAAAEYPFANAAVAEKFQEGRMQPVWIKDCLVLARRVKVDGREYIQGAWLNWDNLRQELLGEIRDTLPQARLAPADPNGGDEPARMMAALPVRLIPGPPAAAPAVLESPLKTPLILAWCFVLLAGAAVGILLAGTVALSERRAAFVSAVTHELRTPLTTFQMYSEMLEEGMVTDPVKQRQYLATLRAEGNRLAHLVENVLSYSRLERNKTVGHPERTAVGPFIEKIRDRLERRAAQAGMTLDTDGMEKAGDAAIQVDLSMAEQILFNLVDNACKYAARASDKRIHLSLAATASRVAIRVCDHGPGIAGEDLRHLFRPFSKSAKRAAETAPGVGLGLALSRRLARQMGGELRYVPNACAGACFELSLRRNLGQPRIMLRGPD